MQSSLTPESDACEPKSISGSTSGGAYPELRECFVRRYYLPNQRFHFRRYLFWLLYLLSLDPVRISRKCPRYDVRRIYISVRLRQMNKLLDMTGHRIDWNKVCHLDRHYHNCKLQTW